jgi:carbonic anhydrase
MNVIDRLGNGVRRFRTEIFPRRRGLFARLAAAQQPSALFLTCADSRIVPALITHSGPGELFIERNPGNVVPLYSEDSVGVSASIEYAVSALGTRHIVICGHSDCGAVKGIFAPDAVAHMPAVARWLKHGAAARERLRCEGLDEVAQLRALTELNVRVQMENLLTHPCVRAGLAAGSLTVHGWVYDIETGSVVAHDAASDRFVTFPAP